MAFKENLIYLRHSKNLTQERLAVLLGVSRQAISKWESDRAYPEMDKLVAICDLFECSLDELIMGDVRYSQDTAQSAERMQVPSHNAAVHNTASHDAVAHNATVHNTASHDAVAHNATSYDTAAYNTVSHNATSRNTPAQDFTGYDAHWQSFARNMASGIAACIAGAAIAAVIDPLVREHADGLQAIPVFLGVLVGLALIITATLNHELFRKQHPYIEDFYTFEDRKRMGIRYTLGLVLGMGVIFAGIIGTVVCDIFEVTAPYSGSVVLCASSIGVGIITYAALRFMCLQVGRYNRHNEQRQEQAEQDSDSHISKLEGLATSIIMTIATIVGLSILFIGSSIGSSMTGYFWLAWVFGGLLCAVVVPIIQWSKHHKNS